MSFKAITLDLDDTLWPVWPVIGRAEAAMHAWLVQHAPATAQQHDLKALRGLRQAVVTQRPDLAGDMSGLRRESIRLALQAAGDDPALAEPAFDVFFDARQQVQLYDDVLPALERLARGHRIVALTNGNADVRRVPGLAPFFHAALSAQSLGVGKPDAAAFHAACQAAGCAPHQALHVGDDGALDVDGALAAGLQAAWVQRPDLPPAQAPQRMPQHRVADLAQLVERLGV